MILLFSITIDHFILSINKFLIKDLLFFNKISYTKRSRYEFV